MPEGLTQTKTPTFSETRPEIDRNGGRVRGGDKLVHRNADVVSVWAE